MASTELHPQAQSTVPATAQEPVRRHFLIVAVFLLALVVASFIVRVWPLSTSRYWDETVYLQNAEVILGARNNYSELASRPPLLSIIFAGVFLLWHSIYAAQLITALWNALGPLFLYLAGRRLFGRAAAATAAILMAFLPFLVTAGNTLLSDSPALTLVVACFWMLVEGGEENSPRWFIGAGAVGALAVLMRFASLPTIAVLALLCLRPRRRMVAGMSFASGFVVAFAPYLVWSRVRYGGFLATLQHGWANVAGSLDPAFYYLRNLPVIFSWIAVAGIALWAIALPWRRDRVVVDGKSESVIVRVLRSWDLYLGAWVVIILAYYMAIPHKEERYILPLAPPLLLLAGRGFGLLTGLRRGPLRAVAAVVLLVAVGYTCAPSFARLRDPFVSTEASEEKEASNYLLGIAPKSAALYANFNYPVFAYYTGLPTHVILEQGDRFYSSFPANMPDDGYLVLYRDQELDPRMDWLDSNPHFHRIQEFPSLIIYRYRVKAG